MPVVLLPPSRRRRRRLSQLGTRAPGWLGLLARPTLPLRRRPTGDYGDLFLRLQLRDHQTGGALGPDRAPAAAGGAGTRGSRTPPCGQEVPRRRRRRHGSRATRRWGQVEALYVYPLLSGLRETAMVRIESYAHTKLNQPKSSHGSKSAPTNCSKKSENPATSVMN